MTIRILQKSKTPGLVGQGGKGKGGEGRGEKGREGERKGEKGREKADESCEKLRRVVFVGMLNYCQHSAPPPAPPPAFAPPVHIRPT